MITCKIFLTSNDSFFSSNCQLEKFKNNHNNHMQHIFLQYKFFYVSLNQQVEKLLETMVTCKMFTTIKDSFMSLQIIKKRFTCDHCLKKFFKLVI